MSKMTKDHEAARAKTEDKIDAQNEKLMKGGKADDRLIGASGGGTKGLNAAAHKLAQKLIGRKG